jgi:oxygen-independent coproporphyrinogen-3 oxidase
MLEVDTDSRLGRELLAGGARYHAHHVPDEALTVALYERACERLNRAGVVQYEISNFARDGHQSRHNLRYWRRLPYYGFGVDAHSMLEAPTPAEPHRAVRLAMPETLDALFGYSPAHPFAQPDAPARFERTIISERQALEESYFLGLRLNCGVELETLWREFGRAAVEGRREVISELAARGLVELADGWLRLTAQGRLLSNEVFAEFLSS